jgi:uncharacterized oxidoreductase
MAGIAAKIPADRLAAAARLILERAGAESGIASDVALNLVDADMCGHSSHGLRLLASYTELLQADARLGHARPHVSSRIGAIVRIDGQGAFGQIVGSCAVQEGISSAKHHGLAVVAVTGASHFGRNGAWPERAAEHGIASLHFVNAPGAPSSVVPPGGRVARLTSNPVAFGLPRADGRHVIVDFATGDFSVNAIKLAYERGERLPRASLVREDGSLTDDPAAFVTAASRAMLPFGGFKGFGLAVIVELLAGAVTGGGCHSRGKPGDETNNMLSIFLDVGLAADRQAYDREAERFLEWLASGEGDVAPGTRSRLARETARHEGVTVPSPLRDMLLATAARHHVEEEIAALLRER